MSKKGITRKNTIIALAYFHRYGWIAAMTVCAAIWVEHMICILSIGCLAFSAWSFVGYKNKWKHIYCSFQNAYHQDMTPYNITWSRIRKIDAFGVPLIFLIFGLALFVLMILISRF